MLRDHPWFGEGYGTSEFAMSAHYPEEMGPIWFGDPTAPSLLSTYGAILAETGVIGGLSILGLAVGALGSLYRLGKLEGQDDVACALAGALAAYGIVAIGRSIEPYQFLVFWFLLAVALALPSLARTGGFEERPPNPLATNRQARVESMIAG